MNLQQKVLIETLLKQGQTFDAIKKTFVMNGVSNEEIDKVFAEYQAFTDQPTVEADASPAIPSAHPSSSSEDIGAAGVSTNPAPRTAPGLPRQQPVSVAARPPQVNDVDQNAPRGFVGMPQDVPSVSQTPSGETIPNTATPAVEIPRDNAQEQVSERAAAPSQKKGRGKIIGIMVTLLILLLAGGGVFAYTQKLGPFAGETYTESNLMQGVFSKFSAITSADTKLSMKLSVEDREVDAVPFVPVQLSPELQAQRERDARRFETVSGVGDYRLGDYPETLAEIFEGRSFVAEFVESSLVDPLTQEKYQYKSTKEGKGYELTMTFETPEALALIEGKTSYDYELGEYVDENIKVAGKIITFTEENESWFYFDEEAPKSVLEESGDMVQYLPPELAIQGQISFASDWGTEEPAQWKFNIGGDGDFGDLTYKVDIDAMKKDSDYFLRINNFPDLFFSSFLPEKRKWFTLNVEEDGEMLSNFGIGISEIEETYTAEREGAVEMMKEVIRLSDKHQMFTFREKPQREKVNNQNLTRYALRINKAALEPFYNDLKSYAGNLETESEAVKDFVQEFVDDVAFLEYIKTEKFDAEFDYSDKNTTLTLWTDGEGYPVMIESQNRIVPNDDVDNQKLRDKQVKLILNLELGGLNESVNVVVPEEVASLVDHMNLLFGGVREKGEIAVVKGSISGVRAEAELFYDEANSYGEVPLAICDAQEDSMFAEDSVIKYFDQIKENLGEDQNIMCMSTKDAYAVSTPLPGDEGLYYCGDSSGFAGEVEGHITGVSCDTAQGEGGPFGEKEETSGLDETQEE